MVKRLAGRNPAPRYQQSGPDRGHRPSHNRRTGRASEDMDYNDIHVAIDVAARLAYSEVLPDESR